MERENWGRPDMKRKEDEVGARENCEEAEKRGKRVWIIYGRIKIDNI